MTELNALGESTAGDDDVSITNFTKKKLQPMIGATIINHLKLLKYSQNVPKLGNIL
jgi:hypothetical protein